MYYIRDSYVGRAFTWTPISILWGLFLFLAGNLCGLILFGIGSAMAASVGLGGDFADGLDLPFLPFGLAALSGVGLIFILIDVWLIYELLYEEAISSRFFYWVTVNQVGICLCASIPVGTFFQALIPAALAILVLKLVVWIPRGFEWLRWKLLG